MALQLRDYQEKAIAEIRRHYATGSKKVILQLATGAGKTATFCRMLTGCHERGKRAMMVVRGAKLVHQASERLTREGVPHGIWQAGNTARTDEKIHVASIDTLYTRKIAPPADFLVFDETHLATGASYQWLTSHENYKNSFFLGVSATPYAATGLRHVGEEVIYPISIRQLIEKGYLVGAKYRTPHTPNLKGVKKSAGEYNTKDLMRRLGEQDEQEGLKGSLVKEWREHCQGRPTLLFAVNIEHAKELGEELQSAGARTAHIDGSTRHADRDAIIESLELGDIDVITSVGVLTTGVDIPSLQCLLICRPTTSYNLWIQMLGRGTRPAPGKDHFLVIDLAGNTNKLGPIEAELVGSVEPTKNPSPKSNMTMCEKCFAAFPRSERERNDTHWICPACAAELDKLVRDHRGRVIEHGEGELKDREIEPWELDLPELIDTAKRRGYKKGWIRITIEKRYGADAAEKAWRRVQRLRRWPLKADHQQRTQHLSTASSRHSAHEATVASGKMRPEQRLHELEVWSLRDLLGLD